MAGDGPLRITDQDRGHRHCARGSGSALAWCGGVLVGVTVAAARLNAVRVRAAKELGDRSPKGYGEGATLAHAPHAAPLSRRLMNLLVRLKPSAHRAYIAACNYGLRRSVREVEIEHRPS